MHRSRSPSLCEEDVIKKVREQRVIVERYSITAERNAVTGTVRVANLALEKKVFVRYTFNNWHSHWDHSLIWKGSMGELRDTDKFGMVIPLPVGWSGRVEFIITYEVDGRTFVDNNHGKKYEIRILPAHHSADKSNPMALCDEDIVKKVRKQRVIVEHYKLSDRKDTVIGRVRVANLAFEKKVQVRYTFNDWHNCFDQNLIWEGSVGVLGETDKFTLVIPVPSRWSGCVEFAVRYKVNGRSFWDNNGSKNYRVNIRSHCDSSST